MGTQVIESMRTKPARFTRIFLCFAFFSLLLLPLRAFAQTQPVASRITQAVDEAKLTTLKGNTYFLASAQYDRGAAPPSLPMDRMLLVLQRSPDQEAALELLLVQQQDQSSPNYHQWLTPQQFGQQFGPSDQDIQIITSWLQSHGFQVAQVSNGRTIIEFSGTAAQVQEAFHTSIHKYSVPTAAGTLEDHWANSTDPQIPAALASVVAGVATMHNFYKQPQHLLSTDKFHVDRKSGALPQFTGTNGSGAVHAVGPGDLAVIYNANPLYSASPVINGTGSTVAVVARSNIQLSDITDFRSNFGVVSPPLQIVVNGRDPGDLGGDEEVEAVLDASYSTALAQQANENFVVSASTNSTDGVDLSEVYIIDHNLGDVMTESFGGCEEGATAADATSISNLAQQAAAQGITYMVSAGDNGSAGCDNPSHSAATHGVSVNILASTPYTVGVGGTMFSEGALPGTYWNSTNNGSLTSAKSYIPEDVWNESCSVATCGASNANLYAGSGGVSVLYPLPSWQSGVAGIPTTPLFRNLPDVSLTAAGHDPYLICLQGSCEQGGFEGVAGTSASVQAFGGIMALVRQKINARVGQADYVFYKLAAAETLANCNGSKASPVPATNCIFYDTTVGTNVVPGITNGDYPSTVGYDRASGLGSVNIANLVNQWSTATFATSVTTLAVTPTTFTHGASATFNITVAPQTGAPSFANEMASLLSSTGAAIDDVALSSTGTASGVTNTIPGGSTTLTAHYPGNGVLGSSNSTPVSLNVSAEPSTTTLTVVNSSGGTVTSSLFGVPVNLNAVVAGKSGFGVPTSVVTFANSGAPIAEPVQLNVSGVATTSSGSFVPQTGAYSLAATYEGDASFLASTSSTVNLLVSKNPTTLSLQSSASTAAPGAPVSLTASIVTTSQGGFPGGSVVFLAGTTQLGTVPVSTALQGSIDNGLASLNVTNLPNGVNSITAQYSGDSNFTSSTSAAITVNITAQPDFSFTFAPPTVTVSSPGATGFTVITVTGSNGFNGAINFSPSSCAGLPKESSCSFSSPTVTGSGTTTLTVSTTAPSSVVPTSRHIDIRGWQNASGAIRFLILCVALFALGNQARRRRWNFAVTALVLILLIGNAACGGGGGGGTPPPPTNPGTPLVQNQTVTVTATSGATTHQFTFTLNVN
jgi:subtilase family serine protease